MDLSKIKPHTTKLDLVLPGTDKKVGLCLELRSLTSPECQAVQEELATVQQSYADEGNEIPKEVREDHGMQLMVSTVVSWKWAEGSDWGGEKLRCTKENIHLVLSTDFILAQVNAAVGDKGRFFAKFAKSL